MNFDPQDPLWDLLGKVRHEEPSPWLATRVVAAVRQPEVPNSVPGRMFAWFRASVARPVCAGLSLVAVLAVIGVSSFQSPVIQVNGYVSPESGQLAAALASFEEDQLAQDLGIESSN